MQVLGIDPGSRRTGWGLVAASTRPRLLDCGVIRVDSVRDFPERLHRLRIEFEAVLERLSPTVAAVETPFHGVNARAALQLAHARGVLLAALAGAGIPVSEYAPARVKMAVTGNGRAEKSQVQAMVGRLLELDGPPEGADMADALAVALCHLTGLRYRAAVSRSTASRQDSKRL